MELLLPPFKWPPLQVAGELGKPWPVYACIPTASQRGGGCALGVVSPAHDDFRLAPIRGQDPLATLDDRCSLGSGGGARPKRTSHGIIAVVPRDPACRLGGTWVIRAHPDAIPLQRVSRAGNTAPESASKSGWTRRGVAIVATQGRVTFLFTLRPLSSGMLLAQLADCASTV